MTLINKKFQSILFSFFLSVCVYSQNAIDLKKVFDPNRIKEGSYKLSMYNQSKDTISNISILDREIIRENYDSKHLIRITEVSSQAGSRDKTIITIDANTLAPISFEYSVNDTLTQKAELNNGKVDLTTFKNGKGERSEVDISPTTFLSNCFSELVQANDFVKNPAVQFETFTPGRTPNKFVAEKTGEKQFSLANGEKVDCWIIKFTRIDAKGNVSSGGYRYIDKVSGKVLMFKTDINSDSFFTYQTIFLH